jgi:hypothetical protein
MAGWGTSANTLMGTAATIVTPSPSLALTATSEASTGAAGSPVDYLNRAAWRAGNEHATTNFANASSPSAESAVGQNGRQGPPRPNAEVVVGLKKWEGRIVEISDGLLTVELMPSDHDGPELVADFDQDLLGPDSSSAELGDILYLTTRTVRDARGYPYKTSYLKLRRPGPWGEDELREIRDLAKRQAEFFKGT